MSVWFLFFQAEDGIRDGHVTGVQTCALPIFGAVVLGNIIPRSIRVSEAPGFGKTVIEYDPSSPGGHAYVAAARELHERGDYVPHETTGVIGVSPEIYAELEA